MKNFLWLHIFLIFGSVKCYEKREIFEEGSKEIPKPAKMAKGGLSLKKQKSLPGDFVLGKEYQLKKRGRTNHLKGFKWKLHFLPFLKELVFCDISRIVLGVVVATVSAMLGALLVIMVFSAIFWEDFREALLDLPLFIWQDLKDRGKAFWKNGKIRARNEIVFLERKQILALIENLPVEIRYDRISQLLKEQGHATAQMHFYPGVSGYWRNSYMEFPNTVWDGGFLKMISEKLEVSRKPWIARQLEPAISRDPAKIVTDFLF